jgi:hypothetical protein
VLFASLLFAAQSEELGLPGLGPGSHPVMPAICEAESVHLPVLFEALLSKGSWGCLA